MNSISKKIRATDARNNFSATIKDTENGPVEITHRNGESHFIVSADDFKWMQLAEKLEDHMLGKMAEEAEKSGYLGIEESEKFLDDILEGKI